jgi:RNA polymerase sigma factor (sigma-70 family)
VTRNESILIVVDPSARSEFEGCLAALRSGDPDAANRISRALRPLVESYVQRHLSPRARRWVDVEDVVQGVLIETVRQLPALPADADAEELVRRVQRTAECRVRDAARNHGALRGASASPTRAAELPERQRSVGAVTAEDRRRFLEKLVARLPPKYADVVRLCGLEQLSFVEAARALGLESDTVRKRYEVACQALARRLGGRDDV